jgi:predicted metal-dependent hydrolase
LPYGAAGVARQPEGILRTPEQTLTEAQQLLDAGKPFHAHEVFEDAWKSAAGPEVALWKALAQLAVGVTHLSRGNPVGAERLLHRAATALEPYESATPYGIDIARLRRWAAEPRDRPMPRLGEGEAG